MKFLKYTKWHTALVVVATTFVLLGVVFGVKIYETNAQGASAPVGVRGFGGEIEEVIPCVDEEGFAIIVGTPAPGVFFYSPTSIIYMWYMLFTPGPWVLGTYIPAPGTPCSDAGIPVAFPMGVIKTAGTSLMPLGEIY